MGMYAYSGQVCEFGKVVQEHWEGETWAVSEAKAKSNLTYQWKVKNNRGADSKVTLPGKVVEIGG